MDSNLIKGFKRKVTWRIEARNGLGDRLPEAKVKARSIAEAIVTYQVGKPAALVVSAVRAKS